MCSGRRHTFSSASTLSLAQARGGHILYIAFSIHGFSLQSFYCKASKRSVLDLSMGVDWGGALGVTLLVQSTPYTHTLRGVWLGKGSAPFPLAYLRVSRSLLA